MEEEADAGKRLCAMEGIEVDNEGIDVEEGKIARVVSTVVIG